MFIDTLVATTFACFLIGTGGSRTSNTTLYLTSNFTDDVCRYFLPIATSDNHRVNKNYILSYYDEDDDLYRDFLSIEYRESGSLPNINNNVRIKCLEQSNVYFFDFFFSDGITTDYEYRVDSMVNDDFTFTLSVPFNSNALGWSLTFDCSLYSGTVFDTFNGSSYNEGYEVGKDEGYQSGYQIGKDEGYDSGYTEGHDSGYAEGEQSSTAYGNGYRNGYNNGLSHSSSDFGFMNLFTSIADTPILMMRSMFDFSIFGTSMLAVVLSLFTALVVIHLLKRVIK